jgi:D-3-phosphoglycerate dehydrogenase
MYRILIADKIPDSAIELIRKNEDFSVTVTNGLTPANLKHEIADYHGIIVRSATKITADVIDAAPALKVIGRAGTGLDNIDVAYAESRGISVFNTAGSNAQAVAELTIAFFFALARKLATSFDSMKNHQWEKSTLTGIELAGRVAGLIGFGQIGQKVGNMASALGMRLLIHKTTPVIRSPGFEFELVDLNTLLAKSDFVSLHIPKTEQTRYLIRLETLKKMKPGAFLINCARGGIVNESDLLNALNENLIAGAALDVFEQEPATNFALLDHPNVIATPHIGASTHESQERVGMDIVNTIMDFLKTKYLFISGPKND